MFDNQGRKTTVIVDSSLHSHKIVHIVKKQEETAKEGYREWRYKFISGLFGLLDKFNADELVLALDAKPYWRKDYFKFYKSNT